MTTENGAKEGAKPQETLLEVQKLKMHFPINKGIIFQRQVGAIKAVDGVDFALFRRRNAGAGRRVGLWQVHHGRAMLRLIDESRRSHLRRSRTSTTIKGVDLRQMRWRCR